MLHIDLYDPGTSELVWHAVYLPSVLARQHARPAESVIARGRDTGGGWGLLTGRNSASVLCYR